MKTQSLNIKEKTNSKTKDETNYVKNRPLLTIKVGTFPNYA